MWQQGKKKERHRGAESKKEKKKGEDSEEERRRKKEENVTEKKGAVEKERRKRNREEKGHDKGRERRKKVKERKWKWMIFFLSIFIRTVLKIEWYYLCVQKIMIFGTTYGRGFLVFDMSNVKYLTFGTSDKNAVLSGFVIFN